MNVYHHIIQWLTGFSTLEIFKKHNICAPSRFVSISFQFIQELFARTAN